MRDESNLGETKKSIEVKGIRRVKNRQPLRLESVNAPRTSLKVGMADSVMEKRSKRK